MNSCVGLDTYTNDNHIPPTHHHYITTQSPQSTSSGSRTREASTVSYRIVSYRIVAIWRCEQSTNKLQGRLTMLPAPVCVPCKSQSSPPSIHPDILTLADVQSIREDYFADDIAIPDDATKWRQEDVEAFFDSGGEVLPKAAAPPPVMLFYKMDDPSHPRT